MLGVISMPAFAVDVCDDSVCQACHSDPIRVGPTLENLEGRKAGSVEDFVYSESMKNSGIVWTRDTVAEFISDPEKMVPGTTMPKPAFEDVENVICGVFK